MMEILENDPTLTTVDVACTESSWQVAKAFYTLLQKDTKRTQDIVILCIGTDRATGDSLGPLVGYKLSDYIDSFSHTHIYGTLDTPVHAKNITDTVADIETIHHNPFIVAIDASLGKAENIGRLTLGKGFLRPGAGLNKTLPRVGNVFITGVVNYTGAMDIYVLQNTRLSLVMKMADIVSDGILLGLTMLERKSF